MADTNKHYDCSETTPACRELRLESQDLGVGTSALPFMIKPAGAKAAALLVHGFTGTPWEMRPLAEFLAEAKIASLAVRLPGHGTSAEDLAKRQWQEWRQTVTDGYQILKQEFSSVYGIGMSTGCLLLLAEKHVNRFGGLILFSPYLKVLHPLAPYAGWLRWVRPYQSKSAEEGLNEHYYNRRPVAGIHQINLLLKVVRNRLSTITCPVLAFNGAGDQTVDFRSGKTLVDELASEIRIHELYGADVPHVLTREENPCRWSMFAQTIDFVHWLENCEAFSQER